MIDAKESLRKGARIAALAALRFLLVVVSGTLLSWAAIGLLLFQVPQRCGGSGLCWHMMVWGALFVVVLPLGWIVSAQAYAIRGAIATVFEGRTAELADWVRRPDVQRGWARWVQRYAAARVADAPRDLAGVSTIPFIVLVIATVAATSWIISSGF